MAVKMSKTILVALAGDLVADTAGSGLADYAILIGLIAVVVVAALTTIGGSITGFFSTLGTALGGGS